LAGKSVLVTRPRHRAAELVAALEAEGARVISMPTIDIVEPDDWAPVDRALRALSSFDWVVFTSVNGVDAARTRMTALAIPREALSTRKIAAVGSVTADALAKAFRAPDAVPGEFVSDALAAGMDAVAGQRVLLFRADIARAALPLALARAGAVVTEVAAYRIVPNTDAMELPDAAPDFIMFTSSESARSAKTKLEGQDKGHWLQGAQLVCIGPITAATVREMGYEPGCVAREYTTRGMIDTLLAHAASEVSHA